LELSKALCSLFVSLVHSVKPYGFSVKILDSYLTYHDRVFKNDEYSNMKTKSVLRCLQSEYFRNGFKDKVVRPNSSGFRQGVDMPIEGFALYSHL